MKCPLLLVAYAIREPEKEPDDRAECWREEYRWWVPFDKPESGDCPFYLWGLRLARKEGLRTES
jgi:hypothetical protein